MKIFEQPLSTDQKLNMLQDGLSQALSLTQSANASIQALTMALHETLDESFAINFMGAQTKVAASFKFMAEKRSDLKSYAIFANTLQQLKKRAEELDALEKYTACLQEAANNVAGDKVVTEDTSVQVIPISTGKPT